MEEITKNNLETGVLRYKDSILMIDVSKGLQCQHYDVIIIGSNGSVFFQHVKTIKELMALPFDWGKLEYVKHLDNEILGVYDLGEGDIQNTGFHGN